MYSSAAHETRVTLRDVSYINSIKIGNVCQDIDMSVIGFMMLNKKHHLTHSQRIEVTGVT